MAGDASTYKRYTLNLSEHVWQELQDLAKVTGAGTVTELLRRSVGLQRFLWDHRDAELLLKEGDRYQKIVPTWEAS